MALTPGTIKPGDRTTRKKRVGRGDASGKGTYSGRGLKGQRSRSGGKNGTRLRGFKAQLQKMPKLRGFKSMHPKPEVVTLQMLDRAFDNGDLVTPGLLAKKKVIAHPDRGVKIVVKGDLNKKLTIRECKASAGAKAAIEKVGGIIDA